jgi:hypothetical protein
MGTNSDLVVPALQGEATKSPVERGLNEEEEKEEKKKRMMGLEPTTFCMASRRSSQLSYIRAGGEV